MLTFPGDFAFFVCHEAIYLPRDVLNVVFSRFSQPTLLARLLALARTCKAAWNAFAALPIANSKIFAKLSPDTATFFVHIDTKSFSRIPGFVELSRNNDPEFFIASSQQGGDLPLTYEPRSQIEFNTEWIDPDDLYPMIPDGNLREVSLEEPSSKISTKRITIDCLIPIVTETSNDCELFYLISPFFKVFRERNGEGRYEAYNEITRTLTRVYPKIMPSIRNFVYIEQVILLRHLYEIRYSSLHNSFYFVKLL